VLVTHTGIIPIIPSIQAEAMPVVQQGSMVNAVAGGETQQPTTQSLTMPPQVNPFQMLPRRSNDGSHSSDGANESHSLAAARLQQLLLLNGQLHMSRPNTSVMHVCRQGGNGDGRSTATYPAGMPSNGLAFSQLTLSQLLQSLHQNVQGSNPEAIANAGMLLQQATLQQAPPTNWTPTLTNVISNEQHYQGINSVYHATRILQQQNQQRIIDSAMLQVASILRSSAREESPCNLYNYLESISLDVRARV
jgi:hypothetical protein